MMDCEVYARSYGIYLKSTDRIVIDNIRTICDIEGCHNVADKHLIAGEDELFHKAYLRMKHREFIESHGFPVVILGVCNKHYEELRKEASEKR